MIPSFILLNLRQNVRKERVVVLHAIIEVDRDILIGKMMNFFFVFLDLQRLVLELLLLLGQLHPFGAGCVFQRVRKVGELGAVALLLLVNIVGTHPGQKVALIPVQVDQCFETVLLSAVKEPVDGPLLVGLAVVGIEVVQEVAADDFARRSLAAERVGDELEVFFQRIAAVDCLHPLHKASGNVVVKVVVIADGDNVILVRDYRAVLGGIPVTASVGKPSHVQRVSPKHTAHGVGDQRYNLITRLVGFEEIPAQLYLTGSATEGGMDASKAVACASPEKDKFEVFTKLEGGKTYKLVDRAAEGAKVFYINGNKIMEGEGETTVEKTGVYRIEMDFSIASVTVREVSKMEFYFCPSGAATFELPYVGNGVFCGQDKIEFKQEGWGRDQRYKFLMTYADGSIQYWGTKNTTDSNPGAATPEDPYFYIMETPDNQWDQKWKLNDEFDGAADGHNPGAITKISVIFNVENYTHKVELAN